MTSEHRAHGEQFSFNSCDFITSESSIMSTTWWFERVRDTNASELFVDNIGKGEIEYVFANPEGNKNIDVSNQPALTES